MNATPRARPGTGGSFRPSRDIRLPLYRNPLRLVASASLWRAAWFLACYVFAYGWLLFAAAFTATVTAAVFMITLAGIPLLVAAAAVVRGCAHAERLRLRQVLTEPVHGGYRQPARPGIWAEAKARWRDGGTWRDVAYLVGLWPPLLILDTAVLYVWLVFLAGITVPAWYWAPPSGAVDIGYMSTSSVAAPHGVAIGLFPHGPDGPGASGLYVDTLPKALLAAACSLVLFLLFNYVLVLTARAHAWVARSVLRAPADPLAEAKEVLAGPGPLGPLTDRTPTTTTHNAGQPASHPAS
jgi:hypothetical protein